VLDRWSADSSADDAVKRARYEIDHSIGYLPDAVVQVPTPASKAPSVP
jgi:hypothetical protein